MSIPYQQEVNSKYGAPMGRYSNNLSSFENRKVNLRQVPLIDGYDQGGAYWGIGNPLYCAWSKATETEEFIVRYFRSSNRQEAKNELPPSCKFYK